MAADLKTNLTNGSTWLRGLLIILYVIIYSVAEIVLGVVVVLQFGSQLITGAPMTRLLDFARGLNAYVYQILQFITYRSEVRPFPVGPWPAHGMTEVKEAERLDTERREAARAEAERAEAERSAAEPAEVERADAAVHEKATGTVSRPEDESKDEGAPRT
jgi:hypothetical protein